MNLLDSVPTKMFDALGVGCPVLLYAKGDSADVLNESKLGEVANNLDELCKKFGIKVKRPRKPRTAVTKKTTVPVKKAGRNTTAKEPTYA